jgi:phosphatidylglycerophosphate synthase
LVRNDDGWVSRNFNRRLSIPVSFIMARFGVSPNAITTSVLFLPIIGAALAATGNYTWIVVGTFIFQMASILDGSDGEVARLTLRSTRFGNWYGKFASSLRYVIFFEALGFSAYLDSGKKIYLFAMLVLGALAFYSLSQMATFAWKRRKENGESFIPELVSSKYQMPLVDGFFKFWRNFNKPDVIALLTFLLSVIFMYPTVFWLAVLMILMVSLKFSKSIRAESIAESGVNIFGKIDPILFYLLGVIILFALILNMDLYSVSESLALIGNKVFLIFSIALTWLIANTICISILIKGRIPFLDLLYLQFVGDAYNTIIPLAGVGGEPLKLKLMTNWVNWEIATTTIVTDRLIHAITGTLFTSLTVLCAVLFVDLSPELNLILTLVSAVVGLFGLILLWLTLRGASSSISKFFLKRLQVVNEYRNEPVSVPRFFAAFSFKFLGRVLNFFELFALFSVLGYGASLVDVVSVAGMISTSGAVLFFIPQGIGANEAGISTAMSFLGYSASLGLTFGLIRRARMIFWALFGVGLHFAVSMIQKLSLAREIR